LAREAEEERNRRRDMKRKYGVRGKNKCSFERIQPER
jgi:hypothetical protein